MSRAHPVTWDYGVAIIAAPILMKEAKDERNRTFDGGSQKGKRPLRKGRGARRRQAESHLRPDRQGASDPYLHRRDDFLSGGGKVPGAEGHGPRVAQGT